MTKPTAENVGIAGELIKDHFRQYGNAATESRLASLVYSILAVCTGDGKPAADHAAAMETARQDRKPKLAEKADTSVENKEPSKPKPDYDNDDDDDDYEYTKEELQAMTVAALKELAAEGEVSLAGKATKDEIIEAIMSA